MWTNFLITAQIICLDFLPLSRNFSAKFFSEGWCFIAVRAGRYKAFRRILSPIFEILGLPRIDDPEVRCFGVKPMKAANSRAVLKFSNLVTSARTAVAVPSPIPGTLINNSNLALNLDQRK